jgi:tetratricopeptide (TPR) repeat protein
MDGYHIWSERYDRELRDIFKIQEEISLSIVDKLKGELLEQEKEKLVRRYTDNLEAYNLCQQGNYWLNQLNLSMTDKSIEYFHQALEKDPNYVLAYTGLANCDIALAYMGVKRTRDVVHNTNEYIRKIFESDENSSEGYNLLGFTKALFEWKWTEAESAWQRSLELNPNHTNALQFYSINRVSWKQFDLARRLAHRAKTIDPLSDFVELCDVFPDFYTSNYDRVVERLSKYLELNPPFWWGLWFLWRTFSLMNRKAEAVDACKKTFLIAGMNDIVRAMEEAGVDNAFRAAACSLAEINKFHYTSPYDIAILFSHAGQEEEALYWLDKSIAEIDPKLHFLDVDPDWQSVRNHPRFSQCLKTVGFMT